MQFEKEKGPSMQIDGRAVIGQFVGNLLSNVYIHSIIRFFDNKEELLNMLEDLFQKSWPNYEAELNRVLSHDIKGLAQLKEMTKKEYEHLKKNISHIYDEVHNPEKTIPITNTADEVNNVIKSKEEKED